MSVKIVVGVNWGDEGKGRMVDYFAKDADYVIRYQGGSNAGHTVVNHFGEFKLHLIPSGIFYNHVVNILGPGTVINLEAAIEEIENVKKRHIEITKENYKISNRAIICFPFHKLQDEYEEERLQKSEFGSTKQGIAPAYSDKYSKYGIQVGALLFPDYFKSQLKRIIDLKNQVFTQVYKKPPIDLNMMIKWSMDYAGKLSPYICDTIELLGEAQKQNKNILLEAQLGTLRDIHYGIYPFTTSSCTLSSYAPIGSGIYNMQSPVIVGVMKAFSTCVGAGPFITELSDGLANEIREIAYEYGAATGRPRRIGYFDAVASKFGAMLQNATEIAITKLDSLSGQKKLKICTKYIVNDKKIDYFPINAELEKATPEYIELAGWDEDISSIRNFNDLPKNAQEYVSTIEKLIQIPLKYVSVGPEREALIIRN